MNHVAMRAGNATPAHPARQRCATELEQLFAAQFYADYRTRLVGGASEPLYQPARAEADDHIIFYRDDFFASALHEVAHWCIAGAARRALVDFGYWYSPDGRDADQQRRFESVEVKPQALECIFSRAAGVPFRPSIDNLQAGSESLVVFRDAVQAQVLQYCEAGLPQRAECFRRALAEYFDGPLLLDAQSYA